VIWHIIFSNDRDLRYDCWMMMMMPPYRAQSFQLSEHLLPPQVCDIHWRRRTVPTQWTPPLLCAIHGASGGLRSTLLHSVPADLFSESPYFTLNCRGFNLQLLAGSPTPFDGSLLNSRLKPLPRIRVIHQGTLLMIPSHIISSSTSA
jgi:hypothetical protein